MGVPGKKGARKEALAAFQPGDVPRQRRSSVPPVESRRYSAERPRSSGWGREGDRPQLEAG